MFSPVKPEGRPAPNSAPEVTFVIDRLKPFLFKLFITTNYPLTSHDFFIAVQKKLETLLQSFNRINSNALASYKCDKCFYKCCEQFLYKAVMTNLDKYKT